MKRILLAALAFMFSFTPARADWIGPDVNPTDTLICRAYDTSVNPVVARYYCEISNDPTPHFKIYDTTLIGAAGGGSVNLYNWVDGMIPLTQKGSVNGVAPLDGSGKVSSSYLPTVAAQVNGDWNAVSGFAQVLNKPILGTAAALDVATSGNASSAQVVKGGDGRLTDARTPLSHNHAISDTTGLQSALDGKADDFTPESSVGADLDEGLGILNILNVHQRINEDRARINALEAVLVAQGLLTD